MSLILEYIAKIQGGHGNQCNVSKTKPEIEPGKTSISFQSGSTHSWIGWLTKINKILNFIGKNIYMS